jgi:hypothetical protein
MQDREPIQLANRVRMLSNSLQDLGKQEDIALGRKRPPRAGYGKSGKSADRRLPKYSTLISELKSQLPQSGKD